MVVGEPSNGRRINGPSQGPQQKRDRPKIALYLYINELCEYRCNKEGVKSKLGPRL
ncbi:hypothetical protein ZOSMA_134G00200 [Zostera marina]|uniref:Uncharacterized protein n=1 Tax=Zostera marina TaxID=29655 RepID=A0A0K9PZ12_ZOSMR|nr:hypothetical protein ZOSMA_134G00200 [Zostera marina]